MRRFIVLASAVVTTLAFNMAICSADTLDLSKMKVQWSDEFDGTELNKNNWEPQIGNGSTYGIWEWGNNEKQNYQAENVTVSDGTMKIKAQYEPTTFANTNYNWTSARIASNNKVEVGLGYVEARIKIPSYQGIWPAFWMLGTNGETWPACGEIDIMEAFNTRATLQSTIHFPSWSGSDVYLYKSSNAYNKTEWHTYGCYRDGSNIIFYIDGQILGQWSTADATSGAGAGKRSVLNENYYILFNIACGGNLAGGTPPTSSDWSATMEVDYVRYYVNKTPEELAAEEAAKQATAEQTTAAPNDVKEQTTTSKITLKRPVIKSVKNLKRRKIRVLIAKNSGVSGYQVRYCDNKKFFGYEEKRTTKRTVLIKKRELKSTYYIKVRTYKKVNGKKIYSKWSKVKKVKIKK